MLLSAAGTPNATQERALASKPLVEYVDRTLAENTNAAVLAPPLSVHCGIPNVLHLLGPARDHASEWQKLHPSFLIVPWHPDMLKTIVGATLPRLQNFIDGFSAAASENIALTTLSLHAFAVLYCFGGFAVTCAEPPIRSVHLISSFYPNSVVILVASKTNSHVDTSFIAASSRMQAFLTLFEVVERTSQDRIIALISEFFRASMDASKADAIRLIAYDTIKLVLAPSPADARSAKLQTVQEEPLSDTQSETPPPPPPPPPPPLISQEDGLQILSLLPSPLIFASEVSAPRTESAPSWAGTKWAEALKDLAVASNRTVSLQGRPTILVLDADVHDLQQPLPTALEVASFFQKHISIMTPGSAVVITNTPKDVSGGLDMLVAPQLRVLGATEAGRVGDVVVWRLASATNA